MVSGAGMRTSGGVFVENPPISSANSEFVLNGRSTLHIYPLLEDMLAVRIRRAVHLAGLPCWIRERPGKKQGWMHTSPSEGDGNRDFV